MSLVGNLEDLGLGEILQIVSLSRKSGSLSLYSRGREGKIVFRHGQVVRAFSNTFHESLGELLVQKGVIDVQTLKKAVSIQREGNYADRIGCVLAREFKVPPDVIEDVVREQIEKVIYSLFAWVEGTFDFELQDTEAGQDTVHLDPLQFRLEHGLNPQFLAIEGSRLIDEMRHRGEFPDEEPEGAEAPEAEENIDLAFDLLQSEETVAAPEPTRAKLVLVDDDAGTRDVLERFLLESDYDVVGFSGGEDALIYVDTSYRAGERPLLVLDLVMPKMDGTGLLGGLELLELVHGNFPDLPVLVMGESDAGSDARLAVRTWGYPLIIKPHGPWLSDTEAVASFCCRLGKELAAPGTGSAAAEDGTDTINLGDELRLEMGEDLAPVQQPEKQSTGISLLRGILEELNNPSLGGGIILLVLRFASEFMNRAVIFIVKKKEVVGLGQFGISDSGGKADVRVRNIRIPLDEQSVFKAVVDGQMATKGTSDGSPWTSYLFEQLGQGLPTEFFVGPIVSEGKVVALLYGDNLPHKTAIGDTDTLEIFLTQAGIAMEKALLQRRLKEKDQEGP